MNSSGRGEESQEAYRGVVLPSAQPPLPYGDHVQPAGGAPWGSPAGQQAPQGAVEPADATQMLPPYPAADPGHPADAFGPAPVVVPQPLPGPPPAEATQMLPPYPAADPVADQSGGPLPPLAPTQYIPASAAPQEPAEATQAMPRFQEPQQGYGQGYEQPGGYSQYGAEQPYQGGTHNGQEPYASGYGYPQQAVPGPGYEQESAPNPGYEQPAASNPGHDSDYDHLFRNDVPAPEPVRPRIIQPPNRQQPAQPYAQTGSPYGGGPAAPGAPGGHEPGYGPDQGYGRQDGNGGRRRMSPKVVIGIVVAGCVVAGLVVGALLNSGGSGSGTAADTPSASAPSASASGTSGPDAAADAAKQQADALNTLLSTSGASRSSVVSAVESIKSCGDLAGAASDLSTAAGQRKDLVSKLSTLPVDKLPNHAALTDALTKAWQASSAADTHYANWANQAKGNHKLCHGGHARGTAETQAGDKESGTATTEKKKAVKLWNSIADQYGLTKRQYSEL